MGEGVKFSFRKSLSTGVPAGRTDSLHITGLGGTDHSVSIPQSQGRKKIEYERKGGRVIEKAKESEGEREGEEKERQGGWCKWDSVVPQSQGLDLD